MRRENYSSGAKWEPIVGYSRAVRIGNTIEIAGTTAIKNGEIVGERNPYEQTICILEIIQDALAHFGAEMENVVRTRIYVTDIKHWEEVGRAHGFFFKDIRPASTMVEVSNLVDSRMLVEIEATAVMQT